MNNQFSDISRELVVLHKTSQTMKQEKKSACLYLKGSKIELASNAVEGSLML